MSEETKAYQANWNVKHNKQMFGPDSDKPLLLTKNEAAPLLALGAIDEVQEQSNHDGNGSSESSDELSQEQQLSAVIAAIGTMDLTNEENTIGNGSPDAFLLTEIVGFNVSASLRNEAWVAFEKEQALTDALNADSEQD